jgi:EF hand
MMKTNNWAQDIKSICLAIVLGFSATFSFAAEIAAIIDPESAVLNAAPEVYDNENWQAPLVNEFNKLDKSGNGLLLQNEASKGKAFNKKTFKQADTDNDGSIDVNEYVFFKTGKMPEAAKPASVMPAAEATPDKTLPDAADMKEAPVTDDNP